MGRSFEKAQKIYYALKTESFACIALEKIEDKIAEVDIICAASLSVTPLVFGKFLKKGQHVDLVGA